jgi:hypothetical protein
MMKKESHRKQPKFEKITETSVDDGRRWRAAAAAAPPHHPSAPREQAPD